MLLVFKTILIYHLPEFTLNGLIHFLTGENFVSTDLILEGIISVCLFDGESCIGVARPPSAEVEVFIDPSDPVLPANSQRGCVILTVAHIEKPDLHASDLC